jgi:hypothetical protein
MTEQMKQPNPLLDPLLPLIRSRVLMAAVRKGIFEAIGPAGRTCAEIAEELELDEPGVEKMVNILVSMGYVGRRKNRFILSEVSLQTLLKASPFRLTGWIEYSNTHWRVVQRLEEVLETGQPVDVNALLSGPEDWLVHQRAMADTARPAMTWVAGHIPVRKGATLMLDIGGAHGLYAAALCRMHPPLKGEVLELPQAARAGCVVAKEEGIDDVVSHREGDILSMELTGDYDIIFMGNLIHHFSPERNSRLMNKLWEHLNGGGTIAIWDIVSTGEQPDPASAEGSVESCFSLLFYLTSSAECYTETDIRGWLHAAGFSDFQVQRQSPHSSHTLITARKKEGD